MNEDHPARSDGAVEPPSRTESDPAAEVAALLTSGSPIQLDPRVQVLMDHYKDTFSILLGHWKVRNRLFIYALLVMALIALDSVSPGSMSSLANGYLEKTFHGDKSQEWAGLDFAVIDLMARFLLLALVVHYYQRSIAIDRQYTYVDHLERQICEFMGGEYVTREGKAYFSRTGVPTPGPVNSSSADSPDKRPLLLRWVAPLYTRVFPAVLCILVIWKTIGQDLPAWKSPVGILSIACSLAIVLYSVIYVRWVVWRR